MEQWRDIPGFEGIYQASSLGRIRSLDRMVRTKGGALRRNAGRILKASSKTRYAAILLCVNGTKRTGLVHRLVCAAFHGPPPPGMHAAHFDGDNRNNVPENLRWVTPKENCADRERHGTWAHGERVNTAKLKENAVRSIFVRVANGEDRRAIAADLGVHRSSIDQLLRGNTWKHLERA